MKKSKLIIGAVGGCILLAGTLLYLSLRPSRVNIALQDVCKEEPYDSGGLVTYNACYRERFEDVLPIIQKHLDNSWQYKPGKNKDVALFEKDHFLLGKFRIISVRSKQAKWPTGNPESEQPYETIVEELTMKILPF